VKDYGNYEILVSKFLDNFQHNADHQGLVSTLKRYKSLRLSVLRYLSGNPLCELTGIALDSSGFPKELRGWKSDLDDPEVIRVLLTLLHVGRAFKTKAILDTDTITRPSLGVGTLDPDIINVICRTLGVYPADLSFKEFHFSTKSGPNGPAMATSLTDLDALSPEQKTDICLLGGDVMQVAMRKPYMQTALGHSMAEIWNILRPKPVKYTRKLSYFSDKEGKTRVIAILDYWSQSALKPLHDKLMFILKGIRCDVTFNQDRYKEVLPPSGPYYCYDLSAATDRMPVTVQQQVLINLLGEEATLAWKRLLVGEAYHCRGHAPVIYGAGQPMGAYSSWAAMALTHHVLVQYASVLAGVTTPVEYFDSYVLLGDDLVIAHREVALSYKKLCSSLDMPISEDKSLISERMFEFAKRYVIDGVEVTPYSIGGMLESRKKYSLLHEFLINQAKHGWNLPIGKHPDLISNICGLFGKFSHRERIIKLYMVYHYITEMLKHPEYSGEGAVLSNQLILAVKQYFHRAFPLQQVISPAKVHDLLLDFIKEVKLRIVVRDIGKLFEGRNAIVKAMDKPFIDAFPGLSVQLYQALRRETNPIFEVTNRLLRKSVEEANTLVSDPNIDIFSVGISKYFIGKDVFSLRRSRSISLAQAQLTKMLLDVWEDRAVEALPLIQYINKCTGFQCDSPLRGTGPPLSKP